MITRDPDTASRSRYELIVVGGGIYGAFLALEASRRGLSTLLLERDDFGGATSWNTGRIIHGGIRYLQRLELGKAREMADARRWFLAHFPDLTRPTPFLMPLYGNGLKRPAVFRPGLLVNDWISLGRNRGVPRERWIPRGRMLGRDEALEMFPILRTEGLSGAALWHDATIASPQRLTMEILHWACGLGAVALNRLHVQEVLVESGAVAGVRAEDRVGGRTLDFQGSTVVSCAGPWTRELAARFDRDVPALLHPFRLTKALVTHAPFSEAALAVEARTPGAHVYFLCPCRDRTVVGGFHSPWSGDERQSEESNVEALLREVNSAVPALQLARGDVLRVWSGVLPGAHEGATELATRETIHDHGAHGGPRGLVSVSGVKYSRSQRVAQNVLRGLDGGRWKDLAPQPGSDRPSRKGLLDLHDPMSLLASDDATASGALRELVKQESVLCEDDLLLRRTDWLCDPTLEERVVARVRALLGAELPRLD